jgi:hypothetical protein
MDKKYLTKDEWVDLFRSVGIDDEMMHRWHLEFEQRAPDAHQGFLEWLRIPMEEISNIRASLHS